MVIMRHGDMLRSLQHKIPTTGLQRAGKMNSTKNLQILKVGGGSGITPRVLLHKGIMQFGIEVVGRQPTPEIGETGT